MKLEPFLQRNHAEFQKTRHTAAYTSQTMAQAEHVSGYAVAKPVIVKGDSGYAMCVLPAPEHVDLKLAAKAMKMDRVQLASEAEMAKLFPDCELGAEPPFGPLFGMPTIMDPSLREDEELVMQAGTHTEAIRMRRVEWERICHPKVAPIAQHN